MSEVVRIPKLYDGDDHGPWLSTADRPRWQYLCEYANVFDDVYTYPHLYGLRWFGNWSYGDAIRGVTGYRVVHDRHVCDLIYHYAWFSGRYRDQSASRTLEHLRPAYASSHTKWYYQRDLIAALLPRQLCPVCRRKLGRNPHIECSYKRPDGSYFSCYDEDNEPQGWCDDLTRKELDLFIGHLDVTTCSQRCHEIVALQYRQEVQQLGRDREWVKQGRKSIREVRARLRNGPDQGALKSPTVASSHQEISVIS